MLNGLRQLIVALCLTATLPPAAQALPSAVAWAVADEEYDTYRRKGDEHFKAGRYADARRQYQNCLEVPGFENDEYAKQRIELATQCLAWLQQVDEAVQSQNDTLIVSLLRQVLTINPADGQALNRLTDYHELKGNELNVLDRFTDARAQYMQALGYARAATNRLKISSLETQIKALDARLDQRETDQERRFRAKGTIGGPSSPEKPRQQRVSPRQPVLKIGLGVLAAGAGYYAYQLHTDFRDKAAVVQQLNGRLDLDNDGAIDDPDQYDSQYKPAYDAVMAAYGRRWLRYTCLGVATAAALADVYLFVRKPKPRPVGLFWQPATWPYGLTVGYRF